MKRYIILGATLVATFLLGSLIFVAEAQAEVVKVRMTADVSVPYLVARPPRPILAPRRITMHVHREGVTHVRLFGLGHHHHRTVRVGYYAPTFVWRANLTPMHDRHPHYVHFSRHGHHDYHHDIGFRHRHHRGGKLKVDVRGPSFRGPSIGHGRVGGHGHIGGHGRPGGHGHIGGHGKVGKPSHHGGGHRGGGKRGGKGRR